ncbi:MAG: sensor histidine kinase, partial [Alphaproteobacteria bacterium]|nr:sensor histidine kinase [Alphaproteobacteria bacterium]
MVEFSRAALATIALFCGLWLGIAAWATFVGLRRRRDAAGQSRELSGAAMLLGASPALSLLVHPDGTVEGPPRVFDLLGLEAVPARVEEAFARLRAADAAGLAARLRDVSIGGGNFSHAVAPEGSTRVFLVRGSPAPPPMPPGAVLLWFIDATDTEEQITALRSEGERLASALDALSGLIEAAPFPIWHRGPDLALAMVNSAYVEAVEADDALAVIRAGIELVDEDEGRNPVEQAADVRGKGEATARTVPATIAGERRMMRVVEVPLGTHGVAGFAIDVEDREQARADLARFVRAQRDMLDRLSAGVAQFGRDRSLIFFNQPFARLFSLQAEWLADRPEFDRVLDRMREGG